MYINESNDPGNDKMDCNSAIFDHGEANSIIWLIMRSISALSA